MCTLERLDLPGIIGSICSTEVSKKGFGLISERDPRVGVDYSDSSDILELTHRFFATILL